MALTVSCDTSPLVLAQDMGACAASCTVAGPIEVKGPIGVTGTVGVNGPITVAQPIEVKPVAVSGIADPVAVSSVEKPVEVKPVTVSSVESAVTVSQVQMPITVAAIQAPIELKTPVTATATVTGPLSVSDVQQPVKIGGTVKVVTADSDLAQLASGSIQSTNAWTQVVKGPFVITDLQTRSGAAINVIVGPGTTCPAGFDPSFTWLIENLQQNMAGTRIPVPSGSIACATAVNGNLFWSGFKPY